MQDLVSTVILLGVLQGALLAGVLWTRRANRLANRILAALIAAVAAMLLLGDIEHRWAFDDHPHLLALAQPLPFLFGPLLYLYTVALTRPASRFDWRWLVHGLPFVADILYMAQVFYLKDPAAKIALARASDVGAAPFSFHLVNTLEVVQALVYLGLTWRVLARYGQKIKGYFSDVARIDLRWLRVLVGAHVTIWSIVLVANVLRWFELPTDALRVFVEIGSSLAVFLTGYVSLWQPELAQKAMVATLPAPEDPPDRPDPPQPSASEPPPKYQRNRLDDPEAAEIADRLESLMKDKHLYREPGLTLGTLADALAVPAHTLSQVLNVRIGKSFFVFVNSYRADALKAALADPAQSGRGVLELAFEVGFSSKSTLNSFFKKHTGATPTQFRAQALAAKTSAKTSG